MTWICDACGYYCDTTWTDADPWVNSAECCAQSAVAAITLTQQAPLRTACVHPDGTSSWGAAEVSGKRVRSSTRELEVTEAARMLHEAEPMPAELCATLALCALAGEVAIRMCAERAVERGWLPKTTQVERYLTQNDRPAHFERALDSLCDLPPDHWLRPIYDNDADPDLHALQDIVRARLEATEAFWLAMMGRLVREHWLAPAAIQQIWDTTPHGPTA